MSNYVLDKAYKITDANGVATGRAVVRASNGECSLPTAANAANFLGITTHSQARTGRFVTVRRLGIATARAAGAIARGSLVRIANSSGDVAALPNPKYTTGLVGSNNALVFEWLPRAGFGANIAIVIHNAGNSQTFGWSWSGTELRLRVTTNGGGSITETANSLIAAITADATLSKILSAASASGSDGTGALAAATATVSNLTDTLNPIGIAETVATAAGDFIDILVAPLT